MTPGQGYCFNLDQTQLKYCTQAAYYCMYIICNKYTKLHKWFALNMSGFTRFIKLHLIYADSARFDTRLIAYRQVSVAAWTDRLNSTKVSLSLSKNKILRYRLTRNIDKCLRDTLPRQENSHINKCAKSLQWQAALNIVHTCALKSPLYNSW